MTGKGTTRPLPVNPDRVAAILAGVARREILPRFRHLAPEAIRQKAGPHDLVTEADEAAERALAADLEGLVPGAAFVGEEGVAADPGRLAALAGPGPVWVADPVDGTRSFVEGRESFAILLALVINGETRMGWIHEPASGRTVWAAAGQGAWTGDGQRLTVAPAAPLGTMTARLTGRRAKRAKAHIAGLQHYGSAAHIYLALADGDLHAACFHRLNPWDHAAGVLVHAEAGGHSAMLEPGRSPYRPLPRRDPGAVLLAPDAASWEALARLVAEPEEL